MSWNTLKLPTSQCQVEEIVALIHLSFSFFSVSCIVHSVFRVDSCLSVEASHSPKQSSKHRAPGQNSRGVGIPWLLCYSMLFHLIPMIGFQSARPTQFGPKKCPYHTMQCPYWIQHFQPDFPRPHIVPSWMAGDPPQMSSGRIGPAPNVWVGECCWRWPCTLKQACNTKLCDMICKMRERGT